MHHDDGDWFTWKGSALGEIGVKHSIGKGWRHLWRLETLTSNLVGLVDSKNGSVYLYTYGPCDGITIVRHVLECLCEGFRSIMSSIERALGAQNWECKGKVACIILA